MAEPLYFEPDPGTPDAAELGYGDLYLDDGSKRSIYGDPELIAGLPPLPSQPSNDASAPAGHGTVPVGDQGHSVDTQSGNVSPPSTVGSMLSSAASSLFGTPNDPSRFSGYSNKNLTGGFSAAAAPGGAADPTTPASPEMQAGAATAAPGTSPPKMTPDQFQSGKFPIPGHPDVHVDAQGNVAKGPPDAPTSGLGSGGLQLAEREGALPADMAAQQRGEMASTHQDTLDATTKARQDEYQIQHDAALKRAGELDAEKQAREQEIRDQQAKQSRLMDERQKVADMDIKTDLVSAQGVVGSIFSVLGAAMLGAVHSDAGLRMIENTIDMNVKKQMGQRDSKLRLLAEDLGSTQQAIAAGKAQLWKIAADRAEATQKLTQADVFAAQTPAIVAGARQKDQEQEQAFDRLSLGKNVEKPPVAKGLTPEQQAKQVEGYGKAAAVQQRLQDAALAANNAMGGNWDPKTQTITNKDAITSIPGVGKVDSFMQGIPGLRNIDKAATSDEGLKMRAALNALVIATAEAHNNTGRPPSPGMLEATRASMGIDTEQGVKQAVEKALRESGQVKSQAGAQFGEGAAQTYQGRLPPGQTTTEGQTPGGMQMAQPGSARQQLEQSRAQPAQGAQSPTSSFIQQQEGFRSEAYQDEEGNWTIGYGHTAGVKPGQRITREEGDKLLAQDMDTAEHAVAQSVLVPLDEPQKQALTSLAYNIGAKAFAHSTLVKLLNAKDYQGAAAEFDKFNKVTEGGVKRVSPELAARRRREEQLFNSGQG